MQTQKELHIDEWGGHMFESARFCAIGVSELRENRVIFLCREQAFGKVEVVEIMATRSRPYWYSNIPQNVSRQLAINVEMQNGTREMRLVGELGFDNTDSRLFILDEKDMEKLVSFMSKKQEAAAMRMHNTMYDVHKSVRLSSPEYRLARDRMISIRSATA